MGLRAVLFDVDDTLVDHSGAARQAILARLASGGLPATDADVQRWRQVEQRHFTRYLSGELTILEQRRARVREMLGADLDDSAVDAWFAGYQAELEAAWSAFADAADCLARLRRAGLRLGVVSNVERAWQWRKLAACGLDGYFAIVVGPDTLGAGKPDPRVFRHTCHELGVAPAEALHVGDQIDSDVRGALAAGLSAAWLARGSAPADAAVPATAATVTGLAALADHALAMC